VRHYGTLLSLLAVLTLSVFLTRHVQVERKKGQHKYNYKV